MSTQQITRFRWVISKLMNKTLDELPETQIISEEFSLIRSRVKFNMKFKPNYVDSENAGKRRYSSLYVNLVDLDGREKLKINYSLWIENFDGATVAEKQETEAILNEANREVGYAKFIEHNVLCSSKKGSIPGHQITACCEIRCDELFNELKDLETFDEFRQKTWQFYQSGIDDACTLRVCENEFKISKTLLVAQSRFFEQLFLLDEERKNEYEITDVRLEVVKALVQYVYLGKIDGFIDELFIAAVKYKFRRLQAECSKLVGNLINERNAANYLTMAFEYQDNNLKNRVLEFVKREPAHRFLKPIFKSNHWKSFVAEKDELSNQILDAVFDKSYFTSGVDNTLESVVRFKWTITDFVNSASFVDPSLTLLSETFALNKRKVRFYLKFEPTSRASFGSKNYSSIYIHVEGLTFDETIHVGYRLWVENSKGFCLGEVGESNFRLTNIVNSIGHPTFMLQDQLYSEHFVKDGLVHFFCEISVLDLLTDELPTVSFDEKTRQTMWSLYEKGINDSCTLLVEGRSFKISKTILVPLSRYFANHFSDEGPQTHTVDIRDTTQYAVEALVRYLYLEKDEDLRPYVDEIFKLATKFGINHLQSKCVSIMGSTITTANAASRLILSFKHKNARLKEYAIKFVTRRPASKYLKPVLMSQEWKQFAVKYGSISNEILNEILGDDNE